MKKILISLASFLISSNVVLASEKMDWNFQYKYEGSKNVLPIQVFDDGDKTIFQFKKGQRIPAIFAATETGWEHVLPSTEGSYIYVPVTAKEFKLKIGLSEATVQYKGHERSLNASKKNDSPFSRSFSTDAKGDTYEWFTDAKQHEHAVEFVKDNSRVTRTASKHFVAVAKNLTVASNIKVVAYGNGTEDVSLSTRRADAIINALTAYGVERSTIQVTMQEFGSSTTSGGEIGARIEYVIAEKVINDDAPKVIAGLSKEGNENLIKAKVQNNDLPINSKEFMNFEIKKHDLSILDTVNRWASLAGWTVVPVNFPHIPLTEASMFVHSGTFLEAMEQLKKGLKDKGYDNIDGRSYSNNVLEFGAL